jgi:hypothetical protein
MRLNYLAMGLCLCASLLAGMFVGSSRGAELQSGPQPGDILDRFDVTKAAGAENDGVAVGQQLCYRCRMGNRPMVMIFAHQTNDALANLVKQLDGVVAKNTDKRMGSFVSLLGDEPNELAASAKRFVDTNKIEHVAFVVPIDHANGPSSYNLNAEADVTVLIYRHGKVVVNYALPAGGLNDEMAKKIVADTSKILE